MLMSGGSGPCRSAVSPDSHCRDTPPLPQAMGEGSYSGSYGGSHPQHGPSHGPGVEHGHMSDGRGTADMGRQAATPSELMEGHDPQLHFDLDQMLDVHHETNLGPGGSMDSRMLSRWADHCQGAKALWRKHHQRLSDRNVLITRPRSCTWPSGN